MRSLLFVAVVLCSVTTAFADEMIQVSVNALAPDYTVTAELEDAFLVPRVTAALTKCAPKEKMLGWILMQGGKVQKVEVGGAYARSVEACVAGVLRKVTIATKTRFAASLKIETYRTDTSQVDTLPAGSGTSTHLPPGASISPKVELEEPSGASGASREEISRVIRAKAGVFRACYQKELNMSPNLEGKILVKFAIGNDGKVSASSVASSTMNNASVESCIVSNVRRLVFPSGITAVINYPFVFSKQ